MGVQVIKRGGAAASLARKLWELLDFRNLYEIGAGDGAVIQVCGPGSAPRGNQIWWGGQNWRDANARGLLSLHNGWRALAYNSDQAWHTQPNAAYADPLPDGLRYMVRLDCTLQSATNAENGRAELGVITGTGGTAVIGGLRGAVLAWQKGQQGNKWHVAYNRAGAGAGATVREQVSTLDFPDGVGIRLRMETFSPTRTDGARIRWYGALPGDPLKLLGEVDSSKLPLPELANANGNSEHHACLDWTSNDGSAAYVNVYDSVATGWLVPA